MSVELQIADQFNDKFAMSGFLTPARYGRCYTYRLLSGLPGEGHKRRGPLVRPRAAR